MLSIVILQQRHIKYKDYYSYKIYLRCLYKKMYNYYRQKSCK